MEKAITAVSGKQQAVSSKALKLSTLLLLFLVVFSGCKTMKTISKPMPEKKLNPVVQLIEQVQKNQPEFRTANVSKMAMELEMGNRKLNVSATCKIRKDSALYLSIQPFLGIEMFKAEFTNDSIKVFDKMNRRYYATDYLYFSSQFGVNVDYHSLQSLLTSRFFCIGNKNVKTDSCKLLGVDVNRQSLRYEDKNMIQETSISDKYLIQSVLLTTKTNNYQLQTAYNDYLNENGVNFPQKINLKISSQKTKVSCDFSILKVAFDTDIKFIPTSAERFTHADLDQLLKK